MSQNLFKKSLFGANLAVLLAQQFGQNCSKSKLLHFWAPPSGQKHVEGSLRGGGPECLKIVQKNTFLADLGVLLAQTFGEN